MGPNFLALDFETANRYPNSACALGLVRVEGLRIVKKKEYFIRPPSPFFEFTHIHGITWDDVRSAPDFEDVWYDMESLFSDAEYLVAHNASFDKRVFDACCALYSIMPPCKQFQCTVKLSRSVLKIRPANLSNVCRELKIPLQHHNAGSDTEACARIMIEVMKSQELKSTKRRRNIKDI